MVVRLLVYRMKLRLEKMEINFSFLYIVGSFLIDKVVPQASGESSKVKVKVRVNIHGIFTTSSASLVEKTETAEEEAKEEPMEVKIILAIKLLVCFGML